VVQKIQLWLSGHVVIIREKTKTVKLSKSPKHILRGHDDEITCVALSVDLDMCVSGSKDATVAIHTIRQGRYVRSIKHPNRCTIHKLALSSQGLIIVYSSGDNFIFVFGINGQSLISTSVGDTLCNIEITRDGELLVTGGKQILIRRLHDLTVINTYSLVQQSRITYFTLSRDEQQIFAALENKKLVSLSSTGEEVR